MSNEETPASPDVAVTKPVTRISNFELIAKEVKAELIDQNDVVRQAYINEEVNAKIASRVTLVRKAILELSNLKKDVLKIKGSFQYDGDGNVIQEIYTKEEVDSKRKITDRSSKIETALSKAFNTADYSDLENLIK